MLVSLEEQYNKLPTAQHICIHKIGLVSQNKIDVGAIVRMC